MMVAMPQHPWSEEQGTALWGAHLERDDRKAFPVSSPKMTDRPRPGTLHFLQSSGTQPT